MNTYVKLFSSVCLTAAASLMLPVQAEDYTLQYEEIFDSPEAEHIVRYGDIDNLGFGWAEGFDPFSGASTSSHSYPWNIDPSDAEGTDRVLVIASYTGSPPHGLDGYTATTSRPENQFSEISIPFTPPSNLVNAAILQIFVDDFQAPVWGSRFQVGMNGMRVPELEDVLNNLNQTGPIGKLISFQLPERILSSLEDELRIYIDDPVTGAGDGYAFDFFRLLINPLELQQTGTINGHVYDATTGEPLANATVFNSVGGSVTTDAAGYYELSGVPAGLSTLQAELTGYSDAIQNIDLLANESSTLDFNLEATEVLACEPMDSDADGVIDAWDRCADTPTNSYVDRNGCAPLVVTHTPDDSTSETPTEMASLNSDLSMSIPVMMYTPLLGDVLNLWASFAYVTFDEEHGHLWKLSEFGLNE